MNYKVGDRVICYGFSGKIKSIDKGNLLVKLDKGGFINCNYVYAIKENKNALPK